MPQLNHKPQPQPPTNDPIGVPFFYAPYQLRIIICPDCLREFWAITDNALLTILDEHPCPARLKKTA